MNLLIEMKQLGRHKSGIATIPVELEPVPQCVKELIERIVIRQVDLYRARPKEEYLLHWLTQEEIDTQSTEGKITFGVNYNEKEVNLDKAIDNALQSFEDGIYRVYLNGEELRSLDETLSLQTDDVLTFIRLTMLSGRMW